MLEAWNAGKVQLSITFLRSWPHVVGLECWKSATLHHLLRFWPHVGGLECWRTETLHNFFCVFGVMLEAWNARKVKPSITLCSPQAGPMEAPVVFLLSCFLEAPITCFCDVFWKPRCHVFNMFLEIPATCFYHVFWKPQRHVFTMFSKKNMLKNMETKNIGETCDFQFFSTKLIFYPHSLEALFNLMCCLSELTLDIDSGSSGYQFRVIWVSF